MTRRPARGFTLVEVVVGLALLAIASLVGLAVVEQATVAIERLEAQHGAFLELEAVLEAVRAGALPLANGAVEPILETTGRPGDLAVVLEVTPAGGGLYRVVAQASYSVRGRARQSALETRVYRP